MNTDYRGHMLSYLVEQSQATTAVVASEYLPRFIDALGPRSGIRTIVVPDATGAVPEASGVQVVAADDVLKVDPANDLEPPALSDICYIIYTSGTTGPSKGVLTPWNQLHAQSLGSIPIEELSDADAYYCPFSLAHGGGRMPAYLMALCGGRLIVRERFSATHYWSDVREHGCTVSALTGAMIPFLMNRPPAADDAENPLRMMVMFPLPPNHLEFVRRFGVRVRTAFSMTEVSVPIVSEWNPVDYRSCGRIRQGWPGTQVRLIDEAGNDVPDGTVGELLVRTSAPSTMNAGYFNMPEETARAWRDGWFHTGDGFTRDSEGNFYFVDRIKDAIRRRGENISSFEVEAVVLTHPEVVECAAVAAPSEWTEDEVKIFVVRSAGSALTEAELSAYLESQITPFMLPRYIEFIDELPKTEATMRVQKAELRRRGNGAQTWDRLNTLEGR